MTGPEDDPGDEVEPEDSGRNAVLGLRQRIVESLFKPSAPRGADGDPDRALNDSERKRWIRTLEPIERRWGLIMAALAALLGIVSIYRIIQNPAVYEKITTVNGHAHYGWVHQRGSYELVLIIQLALAAGMFMGVYFRRRSLLAFSAVMTGLVDGSVMGSIILGLPFLVYFGWIILRAWRVQRYGSPTAKGAAAGAVAKREAKRQERTSGQSGASTGARSSGSARPASSSRGSRARGDASKTEASKRYTPKSTKAKTGANRYSQKP